MNHLYCLGINVYRLANSEDLDEMTHFIRIYTVCYKYEKGSTEKEMKFNFEILSCDPSLHIMEHPKLMHIIRRKNPLSAFMLKAKRMSQK